jgi:hypothetical protein
LLADWKRFILLQQRTSKRKVLPLFVSTEKPLVPLILCMDLGFEENAHLGSIGAYTEAKTWLKI